MIRYLIAQQVRNMLQTRAQLNSDDGDFHPMRQTKTAFRKFIDISFRYPFRCKNSRKFLFSIQNVTVYNVTLEALTLVFVIVNLIISVLPNIVIQLSRITNQPVNKSQPGCMQTILSSCFHYLSILSTNRLSKA
jgi:hypothetical protein